VKALNFGVTGFLEKPFTVRQLKQLISQTIPDPLSLKKEAEDLEQLYKMTENLERVGENYFSRALADESAIVENAQSLYSAVGQRLRLLEMVREQRTLKYKISEIRKLIEAKTIKTEAA
jgi:YesN/AraC family two-component response regulator